MPENPLAELDAVAIAELVDRGTASPEEVVSVFLAEIEDSDLGAFVHVDGDAALARAAEVGGAPMAGVPFAVKDLAAYPGMPWTMGARMMATNVADEHSAYTRAVDAAGLVTVGKTATSELGLLGSTETLLHGPTTNPWGPGLSAGGSSGGAAAAVAAGLLPMAHASDAGGSIRGPAAMCGLFGFKPSNGRTPSAVPAGGRFADLVVEHVVSRTVRDSARLLALTERRDDGAPHAPTGEVTTPTTRRLRVGTWSSTLSGEAPDPDVARALAEATDLLAELDHEVETIPAPDIDGPALGDAFFAVAGQSVDGLASMLAPMLGRDVGPDELEPFTLELLDWYRSLPPDALDRASATMRASTDAWLAAVGTVDVALTPTLATASWRIGHLDPRLSREVLVERTRRAVGYTPIHNIVGAPAMTVPLVWTDGLPIGIHLAAAPGEDALLLQLALQLEAARPWRGRLPAQLAGHR